MANGQMWPTELYKLYSPWWLFICLLEMWLVKITGPSMQCHTVSQTAMTMEPIQSLAVSTHCASLSSIKGSCSQPNFIAVRCNLLTYYYGPWLTNGLGLTKGSSNKPRGLRYAEQ